MKILGAIFKVLLTVVGVYLVSALVGRMILFLARLLLISVRGFHTKHFKAPTFFQSADLGFYFLMGLGFIVGGATRHGVLPILVGAIFEVAFLVQLIAMLSYNTDIETDIEVLRRKFKAIDEEYAAKPDPKPVVTPRFRPRLRRRARLGPESLN